MRETQKYDFRFALEQSVRLKDLQANGTVVAVMRDVDGYQFRVVYYINNERRDQWLFEFELEAV